MDGSRDGRESRIRRVIQKRTRFRQYLPKAAYPSDFVQGFPESETRMVGNIRKDLHQRWGRSGKKWA